MPPTDHPDWLAFLTAVAAAPADDTPRLVAADWLEEHGDAERADFIRVQVDLARLEGAERETSPEAHALRTRERAYLGPAAHVWRLWAAEACPELVRVAFREGGATPLAAVRVDGADRVTFRRGFVDAVRCPADRWLDHGPAVRRRQPVRELNLTRCDALTWDRWLAILPALAGLHRVRLAHFEPRLVEWLPGRLPGVRVEWLPV